MKIKINFREILQGMKKREVVSLYMVLLHDFLIVEGLLSQKETGVLSVHSYHKKPATSQNEVLSFEDFERIEKGQ